MRNVAKFQLESERAGGQLEGKIIDTLDRWVEQKLLFSADLTAVIRSSGKRAQFSKNSEVLTNATLTTYNLLEPIDGGHLQTIARVLGRGEVVSFQCTMGVGSDAGAAPPSVVISSPRFIRQVVALHAWMMTGSTERVFGRCS